MYRLTGRLEQGQLAELYRGERVDGGEGVVVKLFHRNTSDAAYAKVIASLTGPLQHEGVAKVIDVGMIDGRLAIVRQDTGRYTLGIALQRLNTREVVLPPTLALAMSLELLGIIAAAHGKGVFHGALTPGNVILSDDGRLTVADFGALEALQASLPLKKSFGNKGRSSYRAPELNTGGAPSVAADIYALGALTYELLTLREASVGSVSTRGAKLPPPSRLVRRLHQRVDATIMRALEQSPGRRQKSCAEFADGLREFLASTGGIPAREDVRKFVGELFPNEVKLAVASGPVPFDGPFKLEAIFGAQATIDVDADERVPFSGGAVDERIPTSDGLPVFREEIVTQPIGVPALMPAAKATSVWDAPAAAEMPVAPKEVSTGGAESLRQRVKMVEDFARDDTVDGEKLPALMPKVPERPQAPKTVVTYAVPFKRAGDPVIPDFEAVRAHARRRLRVANAIGAMVLTAVTLTFIYVFFIAPGNWQASLAASLPAPIARLIPQDPRKPPPRPIGVSNPKLQSFDKSHPDKAFNPDGDTQKKDVPTPPVVEKVTPPPQPPVVNKTVEPKLAAGCFQPAKGAGQAALTVRAPGKVRVKIDGKPVCGGLTGIAVTPGRHRVEIMELKTKREFVSNDTFTAGKTLAITPIFPTR